MYVTQERNIYLECIGCTAHNSKPKKMRLEAICAIRELLRSSDECTDGRTDKSNLSVKVVAIIISLFTMWYNNPVYSHHTHLLSIGFHLCSIIVIRLL